MSRLRACKYVDPPVTVRALSALVGLRGDISVKQLIELLGPREFGPTPFYILGHNTNKIPDVYEALNHGANALEIDVTAYEFDLNQLCVDHAGLTGNDPGGTAAPRLEDYLRDLNRVAHEHPELALIVFDCKPPAATPALGLVLLASIRQWLTNDTHLNVMISVADVTSSNPYRLDGTTLFDGIRDSIGPREGFMIDEEDNPDAVGTFFGQLGVTRYCYGNGTSSPLSDEGAYVYRLPIERACYTRMVTNAPRFVYAWTVNDHDDQQLYIRIGVDGIIADSEGISRLRGLLTQDEFAQRYRLATRIDNPFLPANAGYGLTIRTSDRHSAGTDANVTFTLTGMRGSSSITVDTNYNGRMESGSTNFVVLPSLDLGSLQTVTVQRDDSGNAPDWHLDWISVDSSRYGIHKSASFDCWIDSTAPVSRALG